MADLTPFTRECLVHGWQRPADFRRAFETTAQILGESATLTDRQLRRWRQINPPMPRARAWRVLHAMFGICPTELGFPGPPAGATVGGAPLPTQKGTTSVDRRAFLTDSLGTAAGASLPAHVRTSTPPGNSGAVGTVHLLELREGLRSLFQLDDAYGGGDVRSLAVRHLRRIRRIINTATYPDTIGRQLHLLAGETAEHCGWLHYDAHGQDSARRYWSDALTTATMLQDTNLQILVFSSMSLQALHDGRPRDGLDLARAAQERAARLRSPVLQSLIAAREARALAALGESTRAGRRLTDSMRLADRNTPDRPPPKWAEFHGPAELDYAQGLLYTELGHHHAALQFLRAALDRQDRSYGRNRALYRLTLARSLVQAGEADQGAAHAVASLDHLDEIESGRVTQRLTEVADLLKDVDAAATREAAEQLTDYAHAKGAA